jgi:DNA-binding MarR family transcriptional regulator
MERYKQIFALKQSPYVEKVILCIFVTYAGEAKQQNDWIAITDCSQSSFLRTTASLIEKGLIRKEMDGKLYRYHVCF